MSDTTTKAYEKAKRELRNRVACHLLGKPVTVGHFLDQIDALAAERDALKAEVELLREMLASLPPPEANLLRNQIAALQENTND